MAPLIDAERKGDDAAEHLVPLMETMQASAESSIAPYIILSTVLINLAIIFALVLCGCCRRDDTKKRMQEEADAAVPPPPMGSESELSQRYSGSSFLTNVAGPSSPSVKKATQKPPPGALEPIPKREAQQYMTMALADSVVFDKPKPGGATKKPAPTKTVATTVAVGAGGTPPETLALADSRVFDKKTMAAKGASGKNGKPPPSGAIPAGTVALGTLALADSRVFDKK